MRPFVAAAMLALVSVLGANAADVTAFRRARFARQISADPFAGAAGSEADTQVEPHIAVDPNDPSIVVAVFQQGRFDDGGSVDPGYATSHDGGHTWTAGNLPGLTTAVGGAFERASDPAVAVGPDGAVYAETLPFNATDCRGGVAVQRSDDGGLTFGAPVLVQDDSACEIINDKNWIAVDTFPASPHRGRVYAAWDRIDINIPGAPLVLRHSDDRGATWSGLVTVSSATPGAYTIGAYPLVQPNADVTVVYNALAPSPSRVVAQASHDGGDHFDPPVTVGVYQGVDVPGMRTGGGLPAAAADPVTGHLHVVWQDGRFRSDGLNDIVMGVSTDGGASWGPVVAVNEPGPVGRRNHFTPAVGAYGGTVIVTYALRQNGDDRVRMRYVVSTDGGATFARDRRLGGVGDLDFAATASGGLLFLGDYMGVAMSADAAHAVWCRPTRAHVFAQHQTTWSATIPR